VLALFALAIGCDDAALDTVRVCGDLRVPAEFVALRVTVLSIGDGQLDERTGGAIVLADEEADDNATSVKQLPVEVGVAAISGARVFRVQALGRDGNEVGRSEVLVAGSPSDPVVVNLSRACLGFVCPLGQTCDDGACIVTPAASSACLTPKGP